METSPVRPTASRGIIADLRLPEQSEEALTRVCHALERGVLTSVDPPWWEDVRTVAEALRVPVIDREAPPAEVFRSGWRRLEDALCGYGEPLPLPPGVEQARWVVPRETRDWLDLQWALSEGFLGPRRRWPRQHAMQFAVAVADVPWAFEGLTIGQALARLQVPPVEAAPLGWAVLDVLGQSTFDALLSTGMRGWRQARLAAALAFDQGFRLPIEDARALAANGASRAFLAGLAMLPEATAEQAAAMCCLLGAVGGQDAALALACRFTDSRTCGDEKVSDIAAEALTRMGIDPWRELIELDTACILGDREGADRVVASWGRCQPRCPDDLLTRFGRPLEACRPPTRRAAKVGRNEPCPCGSGRKYKKCHLGTPPVSRAGEPAVGSPVT